MRQLQLPFYEPLFPAPERAVLTLLHAALAVTEQVLRDEHPLVGQCVAEPRREPGEAVMLSAARLVVGRCIAPERPSICLSDSLDYLDRRPLDAWWVSGASVGLATRRYPGPPCA